MEKKKMRYYLVSEKKIRSLTGKSINHITKLSEGETSLKEIRDLLIDWEDTLSKPHPELDIQIMKSEDGIIFERLSTDETLIIITMR